MKAIVGGKGKSYNGARETEPIKEWITKLAANRGSKGGSAKCPPGLFKSKIKDAVVPLCEEHYPDEKAKNEWLVVFYNEKDGSDIKVAANKIAAEFGNDPPDMSKSLKKPKKKRDRLMELGKTYDVKLKLPAKGPFGMDAIVKVGAVCCDCTEDTIAFCASSLRIGETDVQAPQAFWVANGKRTMLEGAEVTAAGLVDKVLGRLGLLASGGKGEEL